MLLSSVSFFSLITLTVLMKLFLNILPASVNILDFLLPASAALYTLYE